MREKHGTLRRGWLKVHVAVDVESKKLLTLEVAEEKSARSMAVLEYKMGYKGWRQMHQYGIQWAVEGLFSSIKRIFGETVRADSPEAMISEAKKAFILYNILISI